MNGVACSEFSAAALHDAAGADDALTAELLAIFVRTVPPMLERLAHALDCAHAARVAQEAHDLKGCLALVGASAASAECARIETAARRTGNCPTPADGACLCTRLARIVEHAERYRANVTCLP